MRSVEAARERAEQFYASERRGSVGRDELARDVLYLIGELDAAYESGYEAALEAEHEARAQAREP